MSDALHNINEPDLCAGLKAYIVLRVVKITNYDDNVYAALWVGLPCTLATCWM